MMRAMRPPTNMLAFIVGVLFATTAFAQATNYMSIEATAGRAVQLTYHASAPKDCTPASRPTVRVIQAPKAGLLIVRPAALTTKRFPGCPGIKLPAQVVFYQAREGYTGADRISYEVTSANGEVGTFDVAITVKAAPAPVAPTNEQKGTSLWPILPACRFARDGDFLTMLLS